MISGDVKKIIEEFLFLEHDYSLIRKKPVLPHFLDVVIIDYYRENSEFIRIERERGYYDFKITWNGSYINFATLNTKLNLFNYDNNSYYGRDGLQKLSHEIFRYLPVIIKALNSISTNTIS